MPHPTIASPPRVFGAILAAAIVSLGVTLLRLYGELQGWAALGFNKAAGGGFALVSISWLMPVFGMWFGCRLVRAGHGPRSVARAFLFPILGVGVAAGMFIGLSKTGAGTAVMVAGSWGAAVLAALVAGRGWPALARANAVYGLLARLPIVAITYFALAKGWDTHYTSLGPRAPTDLDDNQKLLILGGAQIFLWIPATVLFGGLGGALASVFTKRATG